MDTLGPITGITSSHFENGLKSASYFPNHICVNTVVAPRVNVLVSKTIWHRKLGHPSIKVFDTLVTRCKLPVKAHDSLTFCEACQF